MSSFSFYLHQYVVQLKSTVNCDTFFSTYKNDNFLYIIEAQNHNYLKILITIQPFQLNMS